MAAVDLEQGRRAIDAAVEQGRIAGREVQRRDRDAVAVADGHRRRSGSSSRPESACGRAPSARSRPGRGSPSSRGTPAAASAPSCVGDLRGADVGAFLHDLGDRAGRLNGWVSLIVAAGDVQLAGAIVHLAQRLDDARSPSPSRR